MERRKNNYVSRSAVRGRGQDFRKNNLGDEDFSKTWQDFLNNISKGFRYSFKEFLAACWRIFVKYPSIRAWEEIKADKKKRPDLEGLKNIRKHRANYMMFLFMALIMLVGIVVMYSLSPQRANTLNIAYGGNYSPYHFFQRQLMYVALGLVAFFIMKQIPLTWLYNKSGVFLIMALILCAILAILGFANVPPAICKLGACRWLGVESFSIQPSEFLKVGMLLSLSVFLGSKASQGKINNFKETLLPSVFMIAIMMIFVAGFQKDLGTALSALAIIVFQFIIAGLSSKNMARFGIVAAIAIIGLIAVAPHRIARVSTFANTDCSNIKAEEGADDYHICHAKIAIGSGGVFGAGIGNSVQATGYLPEVINDSIFAVMGEMFGFIGLIGILGLFFGLIYQLLKITSRMENPASRIFVAGVCGWITMHTLTNIAAMTGLAPLTGITMPLISYGGTSLIIISAVLGVVFNISSYTSFSQVKDFKEGGKSENSSSRRRVGRTRNSSGRSF